MLVAGFQGVSQDAKNVTTLGRGGSDTSAVAVAAALGAEVCEIYTDVAGVYSADPRIVPDARKLETVSFEEMLEMAASGAGVLQLRSVEYARNHGVRIHCPLLLRRRARYLCRGGRRNDGATTYHSRDALRPGGAHHAHRSPRHAGRGGTHLRGDGRRQRQRRHDRPERARLGGRPGRDLLHRPTEDLRTATAALEPLAGEAYAELAAHEEMGKVSIVGAGMRSHPGVAAKVFGVLAEEGVNIEMISTSPIKISCVIARDRVESAVQGAAQRLRALGRGHGRRRGAFQSPLIAAPACAKALICQNPYSRLRVSTPIQG